MCLKCGVMDPCLVSKECHYCGNKFIQQNTDKEKGSEGTK